MRTRNRIALVLGLCLAASLVLSATSVALADPEAEWCTTTTTACPTTTTTACPTTTTTVCPTTTTTEPPTTSTTEAPTTSTTEVPTTSTTQPSSTTTSLVVTTVTLIHTDGGTSGLGAGTYGLGLLSLALVGGLGWTALRPAFKRK